MNIDKKILEYRNIKPRILDNKGILLAVDIFDKFEFSRYCKYALNRGSTNSNHMINSSFYRALWVGLLYVVIEGLEGSYKENDSRLISYELYYDEIVDLGKYLDNPFTKISSEYSRRKILKDFRNHLFHSQKDAQNSPKKRNLEIKFPNNEINIIMSKINLIFVDFRNRQSELTAEIPNNYLEDMFESLGLEYPINFINNN